MFRDRQYLSLLIKIALPIAAQNLIASALNAVGVLLVGQLGEAAVAGVGLANQIFFLFNLMMFGIVSGAAIFTAQFWGSRDLPGIRKVVVICLGMGLAAAAFFTTVALGFPRLAMGIYTSDPQVIEVGISYLRIIGFSYLASAVTFTFAAQQRATGSVRAPMLVSLVSLSLGTALNYALIFGLFGLPVMGVRGAALGTAIARLLECAAMVAMTYLTHQPTAIRLADLRGISRPFLKHFMITVLPVAANETVWSLGVSIYSMIYARIGTEAVAAANIASTIESLFMVMFIGVSNASAILIGNQIGAGNNENAYLYAKRGLMLGMGLSVLASAALIGLSRPLLTMYNISPEAAANARLILIVLGCAQWARAANMTLIVGILRGGGDTRYSLVLDVGTVWVVGIPMALLGAFVFHLPIYWVVAMVMGDDLSKAIGGFLRFRSRKWIHNLTVVPA